MVARIKTAALQGVDVLEIDVEVQISNGLPAFTIAGSHTPQGFTNG